MRTVLLAVGVAVDVIAEVALVAAVLVTLASLSAVYRDTRAPAPPSVQHKCFAPGATGVDYFPNCPEGYYGDQIDV